MNLVDGMDYIGSKTAAETTEHFGDLMFKDDCPKSTFHIFTTSFYNHLGGNDPVDVYVEELENGKFTVIVERDEFESNSLEACANWLAQHIAA